MPKTRGDETLIQSTVETLVVVRVPPVSADDFIDEWNEAFNSKVREMPHLAIRSLHTIVGLCLGHVTIEYKGNCTDLRDSSLVMQDSGTGKKPTIEFVERMASVLGYSYRRRSNITPAGALGTVRLKKDKPMEFTGDLKTYDLITCAEADSILYTKIDSFGNDLLTNICESQDPENRISRRLAEGEIEPYTSKTSLFLTTTIPSQAFLNPRWFEKGLFQRFGIAIKEIPIETYKAVRDELVDSVGEPCEHNDRAIDGLAKELERKRSACPNPKFCFARGVKDEIRQKCHALDKMLEDMNNETILNRTKSFTIRRDLKMITYACHHAWLDNRQELASADIEYGFSVSQQSWNDILNFVGRKTSKVVSCGEAIMQLLKDGKVRATADFYEELGAKFRKENIRYHLSQLATREAIRKIAKDQYTL
jgi:hypothetical protein